MYASVTSGHQDWPQDGTNINYDKNLDRMFFHLTVTPNIYFSMTPKEWRKLIKMGNDALKNPTEE